jgi:hypothetical protein
MAHISQLPHAPTPEEAEANRKNGERLRKLDQHRLRELATILNLISLVMLSPLVPLSPDLVHKLDECDAAIRNFIDNIL